MLKRKSLTFYENISCYKINAEELSQGFLIFYELFDFRLLSSFDATIPRLNHCRRLVLGKSKEIQLSTEIKAFFKNYGQKTNLRERGSGFRGKSLSNS